MFSLTGRFRDQPEPQPERTTPTPRDVANLHTAHQSALLDLNERVRAAAEVIDDLMRAELVRPREMRDANLFNALLEVRSKLRPESLILPLRPSVPVIPGAAS